MPKIEVFENKKLVLRNVLKRELKNIRIEDLNEDLGKFGMLLNKLAVQTFGPLVIKNCGANITNEGTMMMDYDLLIQAHNHNAYKSAFKPIERLEVPHCIYARFEGNPEDVGFAHAKLDLFFYENDLQQTGEVYSVMVEDSKAFSVIDIFKPVIHYETL